MLIIKGRKEFLREEIILRLVSSSAHLFPSPQLILATKCYLYPSIPETGPSKKVTLSLNHPGPTQLDIGAKLTKMAEKAPIKCLFDHWPHYLSPLRLWI
jgi:hypothetical protein